MRPRGRLVQEVHRVPGDPGALQQKHRVDASIPRAEGRIAHDRVDALGQQLQVGHVFEQEVGDDFTFLHIGLRLLDGPPVQIDAKHAAGAEVAAGDQQPAGAAAQVHHGAVDDVVEGRGGGEDHPGCQVRTGGVLLQFLLGLSKGRDALQRTLHVLQLQRHGGHLPDATWTRSAGENSLFVNNERPFSLSSLMEKGGFLLRRSARKGSKKAVEKSGKKAKKQKSKNAKKRNREGSS
eukprot:scaffold7351_cov259-Pinguiococcus_pyrenoidosus.AAC.7